MNLQDKTVMKILKPLYGIPKSGNHWFGTWTKHLRELLSMKPSCYNPCLLITTNGSSIFGATALQVDEILFLGTDKFIALEDVKLKVANIKAKPIDMLTKKNLAHGWSTAYTASWTREKDHAY
ncbi:hypothetical protein K3495_g11932 [Podosphaera aphanis]|nr:hypothetical protein K3495_g11932 [Podosphaera aphanis]